MYNSWIHFKCFIFVLSIFILGFRLTYPQQEQFSEETKTKIKNQILQIEAEKNNLSPQERKVESGLRNLINTMENDRIEGTLYNKITDDKYNSSSVKVNEQLQVHLVVTLLSEEDSDSTIIKNQIVNLGGYVQSTIKPSASMPVEIYCYLPYDQIINLAQNSSIGNISALGLPGFRMGEKLTAGDWQLNVNKARQYFNKNGSGIKVGVISNGVDGIATSISSGDLPSINNQYHILNAGNGNEGTAILEIIYDLAPGADLYFAGLDSDDGPNDMATRINQLRAAGCNIIIDDIGWAYDSPQFSEDNLFNTIYSYINTYHGTYISAAGNDGAGCWYGAFSPDENNFNQWWYISGSGIYNTYNYFDVEADQSATVDLQWADKWNYSRTDYDLYVYDNLGTLVAQSTNTQGSNGSIPRESVTFTNSAGSYLTPFRVMVKLNTEHTPVGEPHKELRLIVNKNETLSYTYKNFPSNPGMPNNQIYGKEMVASLTVGAYPSSDMNILENFSSRGPSKLFSFDGNGVQTGIITYNTPAIIATDGVETNASGFSFFEGTSASAPHIAGIAALYYSKFPSGNFYSAVTSSAISIAGGVGGTFNNQSGFGRSDAKECIIYSLTSISPGTIATNASWVDKKINGTVTINPNIIVTIPNGSTCAITGTINFGNGNSKININEGGTLIIRGTAIVDPLHIVGNVFFENSVTVTQLEEDLSLLENSYISRWEESPTPSFHDYLVPKNFTDFSVGSNPTFRANQNVISSQKYNLWKIDNIPASSIINHQQFTIENIPSTYSAQFKSSHNVTVKNFIEGISVNSGSFSFRDPWLIDDSDSKGPKNRGLNPEWHPLNFSITPNITTGSANKGIFWEENPTFDPNKPIYKLWAGDQQLNLGSPYGVKNCYFQNWGATGANLQPYGDGKETWSVFTSEGATVQANYKGTHLSNNASAYSNNSQRKFVQTTDGWQHMVYESSLNGVSHIFYESKSPNGDWQFIKFLNPSTLYLDESGGSSPAIDCDNIDGYGNRVFISFKQGNSIQVICYAYFTYAGTYAYNGQCNYYVATSFNSPNIACGGDGNFMIVYTTSNGIKYKVGTSQVGGGISFTNFEGLITGTNAYSSTPAISGIKFDLDAAEVFNIAWSQTIPPPPTPPSVPVKTCQLLLYFNDPSNNVVQYPVTPITVSSSAMRYNSHISVISLPETNGSSITSRIAWVADYTGTNDPWQTKTIMCDPWTSTIRHNVYYHHSRSVSINKLNNGSNFYFAWSQVYNTPGWTDYNWFVSGANLKNIGTVSTQGWDVHLSNGSSGTNMFVSSFYPKTLPYYFQNSNSMESGYLGKIESTFAISENRGVVFENLGAGIYYSLGNIIVDNNSIKFIQVDSIGSNLSDLTDVFLSEPILLGNESVFLFNETVLVSDSLAAIQLLGDSSSITFNIELIDNNSSNILGLIKNTVVNANQLQSLNTLSYSINTVGLEGMTVRMRVSIVTDIEDPVFTVMQEYTEESILSKLTSQVLTIKGLDIPTTYAIEQNYPNPFNPSTTIKYQIPKDGIVSIKIYDILGKEVKTLVNEQKSTGRYEVRFDASDLASGVYIYRIQSGSFINSKKMMLLK